MRSDLHGLARPARTVRPGAGQRNAEGPGPQQDPGVGLPLASRLRLRAARANRVFCTDEKRIRAENTVMDKSKNGLGLLLSNIATRQQQRLFSLEFRLALLHEGPAAFAVVLARSEEHT